MTAADIIATANHWHATGRYRTWAAAHAAAQEAAWQELREAHRRQWAGTEASR